jgi:UDP-N-acetylmuramoyl-tripeptide--D-alanyl-D-alanine ligase
VKDWSAEQVAAAAGARVVGGGAAQSGGPARVVVDSRIAGPGDLFFALPGAHTDGGRFAADVLAAGGWGVLAESSHLERVGDAGAAVLLACGDPLAALGRLARAWRRELGAKVVAITGSTGKTSTKDILAALLSPTLRVSSTPQNLNTEIGLLRPALATVASPRNHNTEIGVPLAILGAAAGTQALVLELAMRGAGQIAELTAICEPDVGVIVNVGPAHLELLGSIEAIAAAKGELIVGLRAGASAVVPAREPLLDQFLREDLDVVRFGEGGEVSVLEAGDDGVLVAIGERRVTLEPHFRSPHLLIDLCAALAAAGALGVAVAAGALDVEFSALRGERLALADGVVVINDCYNANPMSMRAALQELGSQPPTARRVAVLGDMLELGHRHEEQFHLDLGTQATDAHVSLLITVGPLAERAGETFRHGEHLHAHDSQEAVELLDPLLRRGDVVLVKGSRGVGLEVLARRLALKRAGE